MPTPEQGLGAVLLRQVWPHVRDQNLLGRVNAKIGHETPLIVVEEVADSFERYLGLAAHIAAPNTAALAMTSEIDHGLCNNDFTPHSIESFSAEQRHLLSDWGGTGLVIERDRLIATLPEFILREIGIRRESGAITYVRRWTLVMAFKTETARRMVPIVASALVRKTIDGVTCLLIQRRHRERGFWQSWELPQGHVVSGETFEEAAHRELREEAGISAALSEEQPFVRHWRDGRSISAFSVYALIDQLPKKEFLTVGIFFDFVAGDPVSLENREFTWASPMQLQELLGKNEIFPLNDELIRQFLAMPRKST
jgi:8-oxo-dGTP pyrophosphatase MutT (NUDIX family)